MAGEAGEQSSPRIYRVDEWLNDLAYCFLADVFRATLPPAGGLSPAIDQYFAQQYRQSAPFYSRRIAAAIRYVSKHKEFFRQAQINPEGQDVFGIGKAMAMGLYSAYADCPDDKVEEDIPPEVVLEYVRDAEKAFQRIRERNSN